MNATEFTILEKRKTNPGLIADITDFDLQPAGQVPAQRILDNADITLYALDFKSGQGVFVETPPSTDLHSAPFYYATQYEEAIRVLTLSFEDLVQLAQAVEFDPAKLVMIHSTGRAGSTLASQIFAQVDGIINISEPDSLCNIVSARYHQSLSETELLALLEATVRLQCKMAAATAWVIKGRSFIMEIADWLCHLFSESRSLFLYRDAESYSQSAVQAFYDGSERTEEEMRELFKVFLAYFTPYAPSLTRYPPDGSITAIAFLTTMWQAVMEQYEAVTHGGVEMLAIQYQSWKTNPQETAIAMLQYCHCYPDDLAVIQAVLNRDSQAGTHLSQETIRNKNIDSIRIDLSEVKTALAQGKVVTTADFRSTNTLKL